MVSLHEIDPCIIESSINSWKEPISHLEVIDKNTAANEKPINTLNHVGLISQPKVTLAISFTQPLNLSDVQCVAAYIKPASMFYFHFLF